MFSGSIPALVTPLNNDEIDWQALERLAVWHAREGSNGVVVCGTTGEAPTLTPGEHVRIVECAARAVKGQLPVIAGCGTNSTRSAIEKALACEQAGADALLAVTPYYNKPTQEGIIAHYTALHDATSLPILLYTVPGRCGVDITPGTLARLAALPRIAGLKDAGANLSRLPLLRELCGPEFCFLSGEDGTAAAFLAQGGHGCISVTANAAPRLCRELQDAWRAGDLARFAERRDRLAPLHAALFTETSPGPVKYALSLLGHCREDLRLPLVPPGEASRESVRAAMQHAGILLADAA